MHFLLFVIVLFISGLFIGSFLNVIIDRLPRGETFFKGRSHCEFCKHTLSWIDLIPVFSFIFLYGKCRYCKKFIGYRYPIIEITTGILFSLGSIYFYQHGLNPIWLIYCLFIMSLLIIIFFIDIFDGIIPDIILLSLGICGFLFNLFTNFGKIPVFIISGVGAFLFFLLLAVFTKGKGMGMGDVKFVLVMGILLGFPGIVISIYIAFVSGALFSILLIFLRRKKLKSTIAFGPFLALGTISTLLWGNFLLNIFFIFFR